MRVILVHGFNSSPEENFHPWLSRELRDVGFDVITPTLHLSVKDEVNLQEVIEDMKRQVGLLRGGDIVLGHSLGALLILQYLEAVEMKETPRAIILVAAPWKVSKPELRRLFIADLDAEVLMWKAHDFYVVHSKDDTLVPLEHGRRLAKALKATLIETSSDQHFMDAEYPVLLELITKIKNSPLEYAPGLSLEDDYATLDMSERLKKQQQEEDQKNVEDLI